MTPPIRSDNCLPGAICYPAIQPHTYLSNGIGASAGAYPRPTVFLGTRYKNTHPLKVQGWDTKYSTAPPWLRPWAVTHWHDNGCIRPAISDRQLRSGITPGRGTDALHHNGTLSGNLSGNACLHHSILPKKFSIFFTPCQSQGAGKKRVRIEIMPSNPQNRFS